MKRISGERAVNMVIDVLLVLVAIVSIYPIWYVLIASVSSPMEIAAGRVLFWPKGLNLAAYRKLFEMPQIWMGYKNSILYTSGAVLLDLAVMVPCGFAMAQRTLPGRKFLNTMFVITMYFSGGMIPKFLIVNAMGMLNSPLAFIIPGCVNVYNLILLRNYFESSIPESLLDAARVDGASFTRFFAMIALPLATPIIAIIALFSITTHWNAYLGAQLYLYDPKLFTLQQVINNILSRTSSMLREDISIEELTRITLETNLQKYAVVIVACIPLVIAYPFVQRYFVKGVMVGAVKG